jgi:hypothetical protein
MLTVTPGHAKRPRHTFFTWAWRFLDTAGRSAEAGQCGLYGRTILVKLRFPRELPSDSLSQGDVYVSRIRPPGKSAQYTVWAIEH